MESNGVPNLNSPRSSGFPKVPFDPWTDEMYNDPTIVIKYEVLLGNLLKYGPHNLEDATYHFITHGNATWEQKDSIFRFFPPFLADLRKIPGAAEKVTRNLDTYSVTYTPFRSIYRREYDREIIAGLRDQSDPFFLAKRDDVMRECREVLSDDYDDNIFPHCGRIEPCASYTISDAEPEEQQLFSDDDSVFSFEEEYLRCLNRLAKGEI